MTVKPRILYRAEQPRDIALLQDTMAAEGLACDVVGVATDADFAAAFAAGDFDLILSDNAPLSAAGWSRIIAALNNAIIRCAGLEASLQRRGFVGAMMNNATTFGCTASHMS